MILVDSSVWIDYFNGTDTAQTGRLDAWLGIELLVTGDLILAEVLQGFGRDSDFRTAKKLLTSMTVLNMLNTDIALKSANNYRSLRKKGITVRKTVDLIIATFCIENGLPLLHSDKDFFPIQQHLRLKTAA